MKNTTVVVDLDGTLYDPTHRQHHAAKMDWDSFHELCYLDPVVPECAVLVREMQLAKDIVILTGRSESQMGVTQEMLAAEAIFPTEIMMRPLMDFNPASRFKLEALELAFGGRDNVLDEVLFVLEDQPSVVKAMREYGLFVLQVK